MAHVLVLAWRDSGALEELGTFDDPDLEVGGGVISLSSKGADEFARVLGGGEIWKRSVRLVIDGEQGFASCQIKRWRGPGGGAQIEYIDSFDPNELR